MQYSFKPTLFLSFFCLILFTALFSLGLWQIDRASEKKALKAVIDSRIQEPARSLNESQDELQAHRQANAKGKFISEDEFLLDNIIHQGKPGYYIISPFEIADTKAIILVNRGWIPQNRDRKILPDIPHPLKKNEIEGVLVKPRSKPVILGSIDHPISETPPLWYYMDTKVFEQVNKYKVLPLVLRLKPSKKSSLVRKWPKFEAKSGMHIGYAIQWFVFALFVLIAYSSLSIKKNNKGSLHD